MSTGTAIDLASHAAIHDPASYFAAAREGGPVQWSEAQRGWVILSHAGVEAGFREPELLSSDRLASFQRAAAGRSEAFQRATALISTWMNFRDPPAHTRFRQPVKRAFTPRAVAALEPEVQAIVGSVLDGLGPTANLNRDFAHPIPALVIAAILGVPASEREQFQHWSDGLSKLAFATEPGAAPEATIAAAADDFIGFFGDLVEHERRQPSGTLLTTIVHGSGGTLDPFELIGASTLLLFAGHETTTTLLQNALAILLERDDLMADLRAHPQIDETAVEEFMRVAGPARSMPRKVTVEHERGGQVLRPRETVYLCIAAANHDETVFDDPGRIDLRRDPNPQLGFGWGPHFCLGASLARLEARTAIRMLLDRFPRIEPDGPVPPAHASALGFGRRPLPVRLPR